VLCSILNYEIMKAICDYLQQFIQQPQWNLQPSLSIFTSANEPTKLRLNQSFFVAKDFTKQASYFFRVDSSQEYENETEVERKVRKPISTIDLNYSVGLKRIAKWLVFPLVFCWIVLETAFEIIVDSDEDDIPVKQEKIIAPPKVNSYEPF
jgi:hypothetical protein